MAAAQGSDFAVVAAAAAPRRDLSSGRAEGSEARANPPPPGLSAARLPQRLPTSSLGTPLSRELHFPTGCVSPSRSSGRLQEDYISQKVLQCAGASITYTDFFFFFFPTSWRNRVLHFPEDLAARLGRASGDRGELTSQHFAFGSGRRAGFRNSGGLEAPALRTPAVNSFRP